MIRLSYVINCANPINRQHWAAQGLLAHWQVIPGLAGGAKLHELMGLPGGLETGLHGTLTNFTGASPWTPVSRERSGGLGHLTFDGVDDRIVLPAITIPVTNTVMAWVRCDNTGTSYPTALGFGTWELRLNSTTGKPEYVYSTNFAQDTVALTAKVWYHLAGVITGPTILLYVNGILKASATASTTAAEVIPNIGCRSTGSLFWTGAIDEALIYNRAFSDAEIRNRYNLSLQGNPGLLNRISPAPLAGPPPVIAVTVQPVSILQAVNRAASY
jgi:hypothetical protein